jgi:hypothetical protein
MEKEKLIKQILEDSRIHHNIRISFAKMPSYTEEDNFDWSIVAGDLLEDFCYEWKFEEINDSGNRNLCKCDKKLSSGACGKCDLWHVYQYGRMGATLYWDKYWEENNARGLYFKYDEYNLEEMEVEELEKILEEVNTFKKAVRRLMKEFYVNCAYRLEEGRKEKVEEEKKESEYQNIKKNVIEKGLIKRLVVDIL